MEAVTCKNSPARYDEVLRSSVPEGGDLEFVLKERATQQGNAGVLITFTAVVDGKAVRVQAVTTLRAFVGAAQTLAAMESTNRRQN